MTPNSPRRFLSAVVLAALIPAICATSHAQTAPASPSPVNFLAADVYQNNGHPNQIGIAGLAFDDFNGDGTTDIVAVDGSNCVSFFPGDGKGLFGSPVDTCNLPSRNIYWVASGDFNNDGKKDLAVVATNPGTITLMFLQGNGDGTFTYQNSITINHSQEQATDFKAADLNGDLKTDLVLTSTGSGSPGFYSTYVFMWNGNFSFSESAITGLGGCPHAAALVIADFNNDTHPDLAVSNGACGLHEIDVMLGNGDGTFQSPIGYPTDVGAPNSIAAGDFNGDGKIDLVSVNNLGGTPLNTFLGNGDGTFGTPKDTPSVYDPNYVAVGDFNGDGKDDVIVSSDQLDGVQLSKGDGTFAPPVQYAVLSEPTRIYVVDLNGDMRPDWVSITHGSEQFCVVLGTGTGGFPAAIDSWSTPNDAGSTDAIVAADFNQDGNLDYATAGSDIYYPGINISIGDGAGHFHVPVHYTAGNNPKALVAGNFNKDKYPDIAVLDQSDGMVTVLLNNGDGTLGTPMSYQVGAGGGYIQTADFNGDGILDLIVTNSGDGTVSVLLGNGDGTFKPQVVSPSQSGAYYLAVGDFDGDGILDVAVTYFSDPYIEVLLGNGNGSFQTPTPVSASALPNACGLSAGDLNHDGRADLVLCAQLIGNGTGGHGGVGVFLNNGSGPGIVSFQAPVAYPVDPVGMNGFSVGGSGTGIPRIGDLNNDGNMDIVIPDETAYPEFDGPNIGPAILLGRGDGTFILNPAHPAITGLNEQDIALGDFNNDGLLDIVVQNGAGDPQSSTVTMLLGTSGTEVVLTGTPNPATQGESVSFDASVVTSFLGLPIPTGTITFQVGSTSVPVKMVNGAASYATAALPLGTTIVTAAYSGDQNFIPVTSFALSEHVTTGALTIGTSSLPDAVQNAPYSTRVSASGGVPSYTFSLANGSVLPAGLTISAAGVISGTPTSPGTTEFTVQAKDSSPTPQAVTAALSITVASDLQITTATLANGVVGNPYNASISATGGIPSYTFSLASGSVLPPGLTISTAGVITGAPTATGTTTFTVQLQDSAVPAQTISTSLSITITPALSITTTTLANGIQGSPYSASVSATGGVTSYTFSLANGSVLPAGLTINAAGAISGTPTAPGTTTFTVQATDASNPAQTATAILSITVASSLQITTTNLANGVVGNAYTATVTATGGNLPETFSLAGGSVLPAGLSISATGAITGKPTATGTTNFTVQVKDSSPTPLTVAANLSITVTPALSITTTTLVNGIQGSPYSASVSATGGVPSYTFSLTSGSVLPGGLTINAAGAITGTPTAPGTTTFTVQATDSSPTPQTATAVLSITVASNLQITTTSLQNGVVGNSYTAAVTATGGNLPETFSLASGSVLPAGLSISAAGAITGKPTATGTTNFTVQVKDSSPTPQTVAASLSITVTGALSITTTTLASGTEGSVYSAGVTASGGVPSYTFSLASGSVLPAGLTMNAAGVIGGTPTAPGTTTFTIQATDASSPAQTTTAVLSITVASNLQITTTGLQNGVVGNSYVATVTATGGNQPETFSLANGRVLPAGLSISAAGAITGKPTATGTTNFTVQVKDSSPTPQTVTQNLSITVTGGLSITTTTLVNGIQGSPYSASVSATGGVPSYTFSLANGSALPANLTINAAGLISGTPTAPGTTTFTVQATDSSSPAQTATAVLSITVSSGLTITTVSLPNGAEASPYTTSVSAAAGVQPYTFSLASGSVLPPGLTISAAGVISGTPTAPGTSTFTVQAKDSSPTPQTVTANLSITIGSILQITATTLPLGVVGDSYTAKLTGLGGNTPYTFSLASGSALPAGLTTSAGGVISGKPTAAGTTTFTVQLRDSTSPPVTVTANMSITVNGPLAFTTTSLPSINLANGTGIGYYSQVIYAQGGVGPFTFTVISGTLPPGVTLPGVFGLPFGTEGISIGGIPAASDAGTYTFTVQVSDSLGDTATHQLSITVIPALSITTTSLPNGVVGTPYNASIAATGGTAPYTFSIGAFGLPAGLSMSSSGVITGTPTATNFFPFFRAQVMDATGATATGFVNLTITAAAIPLQITTASLPNGVVGTAYSASIAATGGNAPYTFSFTGSLPRGLTMTSAGVITGSPLAAGKSNFTVRVRDSSATPQTATASLSIFVSNTPVTPLQITTTFLPSGSFATAYTASVVATGGTLPYTFSATGLPAGLTMSGAGLITGMPTTAGTFTVQVRAHDAGTPAQTTSALLTLTVSAPPLQITTTSLPNGVVGTAYRATVAATGGVAPYTFSATGLPAGLTISSRGVITGTPLTASSFFEVQVQVHDAENPAQTTSALLTLAVTAPLQITTTSLPNGVNSWYYSAQVAASGGIAPYTFSIIGSLPPGLTIDPSQGVISGTPLATGTSRFTLLVQDSSTPMKTVRVRLSIKVVAPLAITTTKIPDAIAGSPYSATITATGGMGPYTFTASGLPSGLTISAAGRITGIATSTVPYFTVIVTDSSNPQMTAPVNFTFTIVNKLVITKTSLPLAGTGDNYVNLIGVTGGLAPVAFSVTNGTLPPGLTIVSGTIQGTPTTLGTYPFTLVVTDASGQRATQRLTIRVVPGVKIVTTTLPAATINSPYAANIIVTGGTAPYKYQFTAVITITGPITIGPGGSALPPGMGTTTSGSNGVLGIGGTPTGPAGTTTFIVTVIDANGLSYSQQFNLVVQ